MRIFNARRTKFIRSSNAHKSLCYELLYFMNYSGKAEPHCQATPIEVGSPHEAI
jgi:hypothetical protein